MKKKILSLLLVCAMTIGVLAGCGEKQTATSEEPATSTEAEVVEETAEVEKEKEEVALRLLMFGTMSERMEDFFENEFHDKILEELKIDLTVEFLPFGSQNEITTMLASGESFAFMNIPTGFLPFINDGYITTIDPAMVEEIAPNYITARYGMGFDSVKVNGEYYALPVGSKVMAGDGSNVSILNNILEEVGTSYDQITTMDDFMDAAAAVKEKNPGMWIWAQPEATAKAFPSVVSPEGTMYMMTGKEFVAVDHLSGEAIPNFGSEFFENLCKLNEQFFELGYSSKDVLTDSSFSLAQWNAGNLLAYVGYAEKVMNHDLAGVEGSEQQYVKIGDLPLYKEKDYDWGVSFAKGEEENLERWFELFDWIYASEENYLYSIYGVEGEDWDYGDKGEIVPVTSDFMFSYWSFGSMHYDTYPDKDPADVKAYKGMESADIVMKADLGFSFNRHPEGGEDYEVIEAAIKTIRDEKIKPLLYGFGDYDTEFAAILAELNEAGYDDYCAEYIRQYNEWKAAK